MTMNPHQITDAEYAAAIATGRAQAEAEIRARAVRYVPERDAIEIITDRDAGFLAMAGGNPVSKGQSRKRSSASAGRR
jgi:hypothetical protein